MPSPNHPRAPRCYAAFDRRIAAITPWVSSAVQPFCGYAPEAVAWRFRQRCTELAVPGFMRHCVARFERSGALPGDAESVDCDGLRFGSGRVSLAPVLWWRSFAEFIGHWLHALAVILFSLRVGKPRTSAVTLVFGIGAESLFGGGNDVRFLDYCRRGPITPLTGIGALAIQSLRPVRSTEPGRVRYHRFPLFTALRWCGLSPLTWVRTLWNHIASLASFVRTVTRCPCTIVLGRDAAYHAVAAALNRQSGLDAVLLTNSNIPSQMLWTWALPDRRYHTHMVWYSDNNVPIVYADDHLNTPPSNFRFIRADEIWIWTEGSKTFLKNIGCNAKYHITGPILWYLPEVSSARCSDEIRIAVFDVTPLSDEAAMRLGMICNYYDTSVMTRFIEDILHARMEAERVSRRRARVLLKQKRSYSPAHDARYIMSIREHSGPRQEIELVSADSNMYSFISGCDLAVVIPYSSPALVALNTGRPAIYYDPTAAVQPIFEAHPLLEFIAGREHLIRFLSRFLGAAGHANSLQ